MIKQTAFAALCGALTIGLNTASAAVSVFEIDVVGRDNGLIGLSDDVGATITMAIDFNSANPIGPSTVTFDIAALSLSFDGLTYVGDTDAPFADLSLSVGIEGSAYVSTLRISGPPLNGNPVDFMRFESQLVTEPFDALSALTKDDFIAIWTNGLTGNASSGPTDISLFFLPLADGTPTPPTLLFNAITVTDITPGAEVPLPAAALLFPVGLGAMAMRRRSLHSKTAKA